MNHLKQDAFTNNQFIIIELISTFFIIIALILLSVQGVDNDKFKNNDNRDIKTEKYLYNIFSEEIYSNINQHAFISSQNEYYIYSYLQAEIKVNSYFDCRGVKDGELNEDICQDKIINNNTCCKAECCSRNNGGEVFCYNYNFNLDNPNINNNRILNYDRAEYFDDPRRRFCTYFNKYYTTINNFNQNRIPINNVKYTYEDLLLNRAEYACIDYTQCRENYTDCGIIDTINRHLYVSQNTLCPINNIKYEQEKISIESIYDENNTKVNNEQIILKNILSEIPPTYFEDKYNNYNEEEITIRDINNLLKKGKNIYNKIKDIEFSFEDFTNDISINSLINTKTKLNWYTTNYIGFKSAEDLILFKEYFPEYKSNILNKIGKEIYPGIRHIIISFILLFIFLLYIIFLLLALFKKINRRPNIFIVLFIVKFILLICGFFLEIVLYIEVTEIFEEININIDENYKEVLDLYNKRRFQLLFLLSIIFLSLAFIPIIIFFIINCVSSKEPEKEINNNEINDDIINNNLINNININNINNRSEQSNPQSENNELILKENRKKHNHNNDNKNNNIINNNHNININNNINNIIGQLSINNNVQNITVYKSNNNNNQNSQIDNKSIKYDSFNNLIKGNNNIENNIKKDVINNEQTKSNEILDNSEDKESKNKNKEEININNKNEIIEKEDDKSEDINFNNIDKGIVFNKLIKEDNESNHDESTKRQLIERNNKEKKTILETNMNNSKNKKKNTKNSDKDILKSSDSSHYKSNNNSNQNKMSNN